MKFFLFFFGFVLLSAFCYWQIVLIDKPMVYGLANPMARAVLLFMEFGFFWLLVRQTPFLNKIRQQINRYPSAENNGGLAIAIILVIVHLVSVTFGTVTLNQYLLRTFGKPTIGVIKDCRQSRSDDYCLYQYAVDNKWYQLSLVNSGEKYQEQDRITVVYYPAWPVISSIRE